METTHYHSEKIPSSVHSPTTSPSHDFSFTISLHSTTTSSSTSPSLTPKTITTKPPPPALAVDLSPADEIFFQGHLLPLHFVSSHLQEASSPRLSTHSSQDDLIIFPINDGSKLHPKTTTVHATEQTTSTADSSRNRNNIIPCSGRSSVSSENSLLCRNNSTKSKSFNLFGLSNRKKGSETATTTDDDNHESKTLFNKRKLKSEVAQFLKRSYLNMVKPLLSSATKTVRQRRRQDTTGSKVWRQSHSFQSGGPRYKNTELMRGMNNKRGEFSAPASMRTSPNDSGFLLATRNSVASPVSESTMEELQAAIGAAIAHCKNSSVSKEERGKGVMQESSSSPIC